MTVVALYTLYCITVYTKLCMLLIININRRTYAQFIYTVYIYSKLCVVMHLKEGLLNTRVHAQCLYTVNLCVVTHLKEGSIVEDDLGRRNPELHDSVIGCPGGLGGPQAFLQVTVEGPQLEAAV